MSDRRIPFTPEDEDRIAGASLWGIIAAVTSLVAALGNAASIVLMLKSTSIPTLVGQGIALAVNLALAIWLVQACLAFRAVARTDVADKAFLMRGFDRLHKYFMTIGILLIIAIVFAILIFVLGFVVRVAFLPRFY